MLHKLQLQLCFPHDLVTYGCKLLALTCHFVFCNSLYISCEELSGVPPSVQLQVPPGHPLCLPVQQYEGLQIYQWNRPHTISHHGLSSNRKGIPINSYNS